jgi:hypothetical protein
MTEDFLGLFGKEAEVVTLAPGDVLFEKNEPGRFMYVVKSGEMQIIDGNYVYETVSAQLCALSSNQSSFRSMSADSCSWCRKLHFLLFA